MTGTNVQLVALLGGLLGETIGLRPAMLVGALVLLQSWCWRYFSPARSLPTLPDGPGGRG